MSQVAAAPAAGGGNKKLIIIVGGVVALAAIGAGTAVALKGGGGGGKHEAPAKQEEVVHEAVYIAIKPEFVVNFRDKAGKSKFLKCDLSLSTKEAEMDKAIEKHMPAIRNALVMLLSSQIYEDLLGNEGKEKLRTDALASVQEVLKTQTGKAGIDDLFFSNFVMH